MANVNANAGGQAVDPQQFNMNTQSVQGKIEAMQARISNISSQIQALVAELQALEPPKHPGDDASDEAIEKFQDKMADFQAKVARLNQKLEKLQRDMGDAQMDLNQLQNTELPAAQQRDTDAMQRHMEQLKEQMETAMDTATSAAGGEDRVESNANRSERVELKQMIKKAEVSSSDGSLKELVNVFQLAVNMNAPQETSFTKPPSAMGSGLPPIDMP